MKQLAKPKDKWGKLKILMCLKKFFKDDIILQKMIKDEMKSNKAHRYPEEYDIYDENEDKLCKVLPEKSA